MKKRYCGKSIKHFSLWLVFMMSLFIAANFLSCATKTPPTPQAFTPAPLPVLPETPAGETKRMKQYSSPPAMALDLKKDYTATLHTSKGDIVLEFFPQEAPKTVNNFIFLAREGFYNGTKFHRIIKNFMIQGGDPLGNGTGGPGYRFEDEPVKRDYVAGTIAMANAGPNTNGSQFFIMHRDVSLPKLYTIFGKAVQGMEVVDKIANTPVSRNASGEPSVPMEDNIVLSIDIKEAVRAQ